MVLRARAFVNMEEAARKNDKYTPTVQKEKEFKEMKELLAIVDKAGFGKKCNEEEDVLSPSKKGNSRAPYSSTKKSPRVGSPSPTKKLARVGSSSLSRGVSFAVENVPPNLYHDLAKGLEKVTADDDSEEESPPKDKLSRGIIHNNVREGEIVKKEEDDAAAVTYALNAFSDLVPANPWPVAVALGVLIFACFIQGIIILYLVVDKYFKNT